MNRPSWIHGKNFTIMGGKQLLSITGGKVWLPGQVGCLLIAGGRCQDVSYLMNMLELINIWQSVESYRVKTWTTLVRIGI